MNTPREPIGLVRRIEFSPHPFGGAIGTLVYQLRCGETKVDAYAPTLGCGLYEDHPLPHYDATERVAWYPEAAK